MAVTSFWFAGAFIQAFDKEFDFLADAMKVALTTSSYTPNQDTHDYFNDVTNEHGATGGYTAGGTTLTTPANSNTNHVVKWDADDAQWTSSTLTARRAVLYDSTPGTAATNPVMTWVDFGVDESSSSGTFKIVWDAAGIATVTATDATGFP